MIQDDRIEVAAEEPLFKLEINELTRRRRSSSS